MMRFRLHNLRFLAAADTSRPPADDKPGRRKAMVLLSVLVVVVILSLAAYQYSDLTLAEYQAADSSVQSGNARVLADSGISYLATLLSDPNSVTGVLSGNWYDNAQTFQNVLVQENKDQPRLQGRFSIVAVNPGSTGPGSGSLRFGVTDEASRININAVMQADPTGNTLYNMLLQLPNMTDDVANAIVDWVDTDTTPRSNGAEDETYGTMNPSYHAKNGPLDSIEELLLVRGVTSDLLFGNDHNRNGLLDPGEDDGSGQTNPGWAGYFTLYSREQNVDSSGNPRINVNQSDLNALYTSLQSSVSQDLATYIVLYRQYGPAPTPATGNKTGNTASSANKTASSTASSSTSSASSNSASVSGNVRGMAASKLNLRGKGNTSQIASLYDLVNSSVVVPGTTPQTPGTLYPSPLKNAANLAQYLPILLDKATTSANSEIPGRVNINMAPDVVLYTLPGLTTDQVGTILALRPAPAALLSDPTYATPAWLLTQANFSVTALKQLEPYITTRSQVYRVQSLGYFDQGGPTARIEAVIDTSYGRPRIVYRRDLSELGRGYDLTNNP